MSWLATVSPNGRSLAPVPPGASLLMLNEPHSPAAEAYRSLAANLQFSSADRQLQTVGVTSAAAGEGKSTTVANLAIALAEGDRRVIVIDADPDGKDQLDLSSVKIVTAPAHGTVNIVFAPPPDPQSMPDAEIPILPG